MGLSVYTSGVRELLEWAAMRRHDARLRSRVPPRRVKSSLAWMKGKRPGIMRVFIWQDSIQKRFFYYNICVFHSRKNLLVLHQLNKIKKFADIFGCSSGTDPDAKSDQFTAKNIRYQNANFIMGVMGMVAWENFVNRVWAFWRVFWSKIGVLMSIYLQYIQLRVISTQISSLIAFTIMNEKVTQTKLIIDNWLIMYLVPWNAGRI